MNTRTLCLAAWLGVGVALAACDPSPACDPGQHKLNNVCVQDAPQPGDGDGDGDDDGGVEDATDGSDSGASLCPGETYEGYGDPCESDDDCGCHADRCAISPLNYCTKLNCDPDEPSDCPPEWTCFEIPPGTSPDPTITHVCLQ